MLPSSTAGPETCLCLAGRLPLGSSHGCLRRVRTPSPLLSIPLQQMRAPRLPHTGLSFQRDQIGLHTGGIVSLQRPCWHPKSFNSL